MSRAHATHPDVHPLAEAPFRAAREGSTNPAALASAPAASSAAPARSGAVLAVLCAAVFMASLDMFVVNVAFAKIGAEFAGSSVARLSLILNGYTIFYGALLVPAGRLADRFGRRAGFQAGLALFTLASLACGASTSLDMLIASRCLQAIGAAVLTPASLGLVITSFPGPARARAVRIWTASGALAGAAGPIVGGLLVDASWRWIFLLNLPIGATALLATARLVPAVPGDRASRFPDVLGGALLIVATGALALGLVEAPDRGFTSTHAWLAWGITAASLAWFAARTARHPSPVVDPRLLKNPVFVWSNLVLGLLSITFAAELLGVVLAFERIFDGAMLTIGFAMAPGPCLVPLWAALGHRLNQRWSAGAVAFAGALAFALAPLLMIAGSQGGLHYLGILPGWVLAGVGVGFSIPTGFAAATASLPPEQSSTGSAVANMSRQVGMVIGTSVLLGIVGAASASTRAFASGFWFASAVAALGAAAALGLRRATPRAR